MILIICTEMRPVLVYLISTHWYLCIMQNVLATNRIFFGIRSTLFFLSKRWLHARWTAQKDVSKSSASVWCQQSYTYSLTTINNRHVEQSVIQIIALKYWPLLRPTEWSYTSKQVPRLWFIQQIRHQCLASALLKNSWFPKHSLHIRLLSW